MNKLIAISILAVFFQLGTFASETGVMASYPFNLENGRIQDIKSGKLVLT